LDIKFEEEELMHKQFGEEAQWRLQQSSAAWLPDSPELLRAESQIDFETRAENHRHEMRIRELKREEQCLPEEAAPVLMRSSLPRCSM
jgi:hypothetical protein